jgi:hypothetical protein
MVNVGGSLSRSRHKIVSDVEGQPQQSRHDGGR